MTTHATPPETAGPQIPLHNPVPPMPAHAPAHVFLSKVPDGAPPPWAKLTVTAQTKRGCHILWRQGRDWALLETVEDDTLHKDVTRRRAAEARKAREQHRKDVRDLQKQIRDAAQQGHSTKADRYQQALASVLAAGTAHGHVDDEVTEQDVARHRRGQQASRCAMVAAGVVGAVMYGPQHLILLTAGILGGIGAAYWAGRDRETSGDKESSSAAMAAESPATIAAAASVGDPGAAVLTKSEDVQVRGANDLVTALVKARIIEEGDREETRVLGLRTDGPGWTAIIELPGGRTAEQAIARLVPLAGALRVKASRIEMKKDTSAEGHEGRFTIWVADADNPFGPGKTPSPLISIPKAGYLVYPRGNAPTPPPASLNAKSSSACQRLLSPMIGSGSTWSSSLSRLP